MKFNLYRYKEQIDGNPNSDPEDHFLNIYWSSLPELECSNIMLKLSTFIFDLEYFFDEKSAYFLKSDENFIESYTLNYFKIIKILFKYFRHFLFTKVNTNFAMISQKFEHRIESKLESYLRSLDNVKVEIFPRSNSMKSIMIGQNPKVHIIDLLILQFLYLYDNQFCKKENVIFKKFTHVTISNKIESLKKNFQSTDFYMKLNIIIEIFTEIIGRIEYLNYIFESKPSYFEEEVYDNDSNLVEFLESKENLFKIENYHIIMKYVYNVQSSNFLRLLNTEKFRYVENNILTAHYFTNVGSEKITLASFLDMEGEVNQKNNNIWSLFDIFGFSDFNSIIMSHGLSDSFIGGESPERKVSHIHLKDYLFNFNDKGEIYERFSNDLELNTFTFSTMSRSVFEPCHYFYTKYFNEYTDLTNYFLRYEDFQKLFNEHFVTINKNLPIIYIYDLIYYSKSYFRTELFTKSMENRKKSFEGIIKIFGILKRILQDNKYKSLIDKLKPIFQCFQDSDYGVILNLVVYFSNHKITNLFKMLLNESIKDKKINLNVILDEYILLTQKIIDLFCEFNQGSIDYLTSNIGGLIDSLKIILSDFEYETFIDLKSILDNILDFKYQGYLLLKFACDELTSLPQFLKTALKNYDMNIMKKDFIIANVAAEKLIKMKLDSENINYDKNAKTFYLINLHWSQIEKESVYRMCRTIFVVFKYLQDVYGIREFDDFFMDEENNTGLSTFVFLKKKTKKSKTESKNESLYFGKEKIPHLGSEKQNISKNPFDELESIPSSPSKKQSAKNVTNKSFFAGGSDNKLKDKSYENADYVDNFMNDKEIIHDLIKFYDKITRHIELFYCPDYMNINIETGKKDKKNLRKIFFEINPNYENLTKSSTMFFLNNCKRDSQVVKLSELVNQIDFFKTEIEYLTANTSDLKKFLKLIDFKHSEIFLFFISLIMNFIFLKQLVYKDNEIQFPLPSVITIKFLNFFQIVYCSFILYIWHTNKHLIYYNALINRHSKMKITLLTKIKFYIYDSFLEKKEMNGFIYVFILSLLSFFSTDSYYLLGLQLSSLINLNKYLTNVLNVMKKRFQQIIQTLLLLLIIIYLYMIIGFYFFNDEYYDEDLKENICNQLLQCYIMHISYGIRSGGGIGDHLPKHYFNQERTLSVKRALFDLLWYFPVNLLMLNVILGVIVDTFKELRVENDAYENDRDNACFICGLDRNTARKKGIDFFEHINRDHHIWNYAFFLINLQKLQGQDMNTYEFYVDGQLKNQNFNFFPDHEEA